jgi:hypothetical protein
MKIRRKTSICMNCGSTLNEVYNFCPSCGQENNNKNVSLRHVMGDFFNNYFALDSKLGKSFKPFLFHPGFLTLKFNEGKRASYISPLRLYLVISLLYFFIINIVIQNFVEDEKYRMEVKAVSQNNLQKDKNKNQALTEHNLNSGLKDKGVLGDSLDKTTEHQKKNEQDVMAKFVKYRYDVNVTNDMLYDSLNLKSQNENMEIFLKKLIKVGRSDPAFITSYIVKNLPVMMFLLLPLFALILKLLYIRRGILYIQHLIHALHLHAFAYLLYGISIILIFSLPKEWDYGSTIFLISFILVSTYAFLSFKNVYKQKLKKTFLKFLLLGGIYAYFLIIFFIGEIFISILIF